MIFQKLEQKFSSKRPAQFAVVCSAVLLSGCILTDKSKITGLALSPSGDRLAYSQFCYGNRDKISVLNTLDWSKMTPIVVDKGNYIGSPSFSNSGKKITYTSGPRYTGEDEDSVANGIFVFDLETNQRTQILWSDLPNARPTFSLDDKKIAFIRAGLRRPPGSRTPVGAFDVYEVDIDSGEITQLTTRRMYSISTLSYSIDNESILIAGYWGGNSSNSIGRIDRKTKDVEAIPTGRRMGQLDIATISGEALFIDEVGKNNRGKINYEAFILRDGKIKQLTTEQSYLAIPNISADGKQVAFLSDIERDKSFDVLLMDLLTNKTTMLPKNELLECGS